MSYSDHTDFRRSDTKVIVPMRNLKDMFVSFYHHLNATMKVKTELKPWADYFNFLLHCPTGETSVSTARWSINMSDSVLSSLTGV